MQLHSFLTSAKSTRLGRFSLGKEHELPTEQDTGWAPQPVWIVFSGLEMNWDPPEIHPLAQTLY
jgi:hypothetical protein